MKFIGLKVAAVQMNSGPGLARNLGRIAAAVERTAGEGAAAVLFPECATTGYAHGFERVTPADIDAALRFVGDTARRWRCNVLVGSPTFQGRKLFNSLVVFDRRGREIFRYAKIHLTARDSRWFHPGDALAYFTLDGVACTAIICHERRYPELVRIPVMMGAQIIFHPNAGLDTLAASKKKRSGRDGIAVRAFENEVYYVFANTVGRQAPGLWSAGDSKIVAPDASVLALADHRRETIITAELDLRKAGRTYAREALAEPRFLRAHWQRMLAACRPNA